MMKYKYEANGRNITARPQPSDGKIGMAFTLLEVNEYVMEPEALAKNLAELLNTHWSEE